MNKYTGSNTIAFTYDQIAIRRFMKGHKSLILISSEYFQTNNNLKRILQMQIADHPILLFFVIFMVSTKKLSEAGKGKGCEIGIGVGGGYGAALACVISGPLAPLICPVAAGAVAGLTAVCRRRRSV